MAGRPAVLAVLACLCLAVSAQFRQGDVVGLAYKHSSFQHGWVEATPTSSPRFGAARIVYVSFEASSTASDKIKFSFAHDRFAAPWIPLFQKGRPLIAVRFDFTHSENDILALHSFPQYGEVDAESPARLALVYTWELQEPLDPVLATRLLFVVGTLGTIGLLLMVLLKSTGPEGYVAHFRRLGSEMGAASAALVEARRESERQTVKSE